MRSLTERGLSSSVLLGLAVASEPFGDQAAVSLFALGGAVGAEEMVFPVEGDAGLTRAVAAVIWDAGFAKHCDSLQS